MVPIQALLLAAAAMLAPASAQVNLGSACNFLILATSGITTGASGQFNGNFGINPTSIAAVTIGAGMQAVPSEDFWVARPHLTGIVRGPGVVTALAHADGMAAFTQANTSPPTGASDERNPVLDNQVFTPGTYRWTRAVVMSAGSSVTLAGGPGAVFIFQMTELATGAASKVILTGGVTAATIYWVPSSVLGLGAASEFYGQALCGSAANVGAGAAWDGAIFAQSAVNIGTNVIMSNESGACGAAARVKRSQLQLARDANSCSSGSCPADVGLTKAKRSTITL